MEDPSVGASGRPQDRELLAEKEAAKAKWIDIREAARALNVSEKTIRRRIKAGKVRSQKISGAWFVAVEDHPKLRDVPSPLPPAAAPTPRIAPAPAPSNEKLDEIRDSARYILKRLDEVDKKLFVLAEERELIIASGPANTRKMEETIERLGDENRRLREELEAERVYKDKESGESLRTLGDEPRPDEKTVGILPKTETDDTLELKAVLASKERGLSMLRDEIRKKDSLLRQKEDEIAELESELRTLKDE